jgi:MerR family transcriptional regulator, light-induced transcriptional regulator
VTGAPTGLVTLHEAAERLGVHYMTAYRRVRMGILPARKVGGTWWIDPADLDRRVAATSAAAPGRRSAGAPDDAPAWRERLRGRMLSGDLAGSWQVVEAAMAAGREPRDIYVEVLAPALHAVGDLWQSGTVGIEQEHLASSVATSLIGRLGPRFARRGRKKGIVIVAMPPGERHGLGVAMLADILTQDGYEVRNLGPDTPAPSLVATMRDADQLAAVVVSVVDARHRGAAEKMLSAARHERPSVPLIAGGSAVPDERSASELGASGWAADPRELAGLIEKFRPD